MPVPLSPGGDVVRLAALGDIHYSKSSHGSLQPLFSQIAESADVLMLFFIIHVVMTIREGRVASMITGKP